MSLTAFALNCTLKPSPAPSSCDLLLCQVAAAFDKHAIPTEILRAVDHDIKPGVLSDQGEGDEWPEIRRKILAADIFILGTPIWLGHPSSICQRVLERLDAFLGETDDAGRMISYDRLAAVVVVGNEDGAHHVSSQLFQGLNDVGFTLPASAVTYWVGEAMQGTNYNDLGKTPEKIAKATETLAANCAHLATLLQTGPYPAP
ncbi:flavodoxin family protein [Bordetella genomosp. 13]|uniref:flavodoxin family protein n=1 Tax=Bordetella genomosp. 13 TaxID=463040 RepID=UPI00119D9854|nr:NAD(P)H-dependent oxidoreductase [Bordetella genomosp. 13]